MVCWEGIHITLVLVKFYTRTIRTIFPNSAVVSKLTYKYVTVFSLCSRRTTTGELRLIHNFLTNYEMSFRGRKSCRKFVVRLRHSANVSDTWKYLTTEWTLVDICCFRPAWNRSGSAIINYMPHSTRLQDRLDIAPDKSA